MKASIKDSFKRLKRVVTGSKKSGKSVTAETSLVDSQDPQTGGSTSSSSQQQHATQPSCCSPQQQELQQKPSKPKPSLKPKPNQRTILFSALDSQGHINSMICIANHLKSLNMRTVFLLVDPIKTDLERQGHEVFDSTSAELKPSSYDDDSAQNKWNDVIKKCHETWQKNDVLLNYEEEMKLGFGAMIDDIKKYNDNIARKLDLLKPDCIVVDHYFGIPAIFKYIQDHSIPWIRVLSAAPLMLHNSDSLPPAYLGLPSAWNKEDAEQAKQVAFAKQLSDELYNEYNTYFTSFGLEPLPQNPVSYIPVSKHLNLYMFPNELDYDEDPLVEWTQCESILRTFEPEPFELPESLRDKPGKLIYFSLGSLASANVVLLRRVLDMLADSPHRFIVCKGPFADQYELPANMWGAKYINQLSVLSAADLVITHGGNNTVTESFYHGVGGLIVCPLFGDQFDNAERIKEKGFGIRLNPYTCSKEELLAAIESLASNDDLRAKMKAIGERMQRPEVRMKAMREVESLLRTKGLLN